MLDIFAPYKWEALFERWPDILMAFGTTVGISVLALVIALALGIVFGVLSVSRIPVLRGITRVYVEVVQNVPLLLQVFVFYAIFPLLGLSLAAFWIGVLAIGIYHGGYISEVVRSGIGSIHRGQFEAAKSQGFTYWQSMFVIILPQAIRIIMPPLAVQAANLVKNTSVLALIAGGELMYFSNSFAGATSYYGPVYVVAALLYFAICFPLSRLALYLERRTRSHRHLATGDATRGGRHDGGRRADHVRHRGHRPGARGALAAPSAARACRGRAGAGRGAGGPVRSDVHRQPGGRDRRRDRARDRPGDR